MLQLLPMSSKTMSFLIYTTCICICHLRKLWDNRLYTILNNPCHLFTSMNKEKVLNEEENDVGKNCFEKRRLVWLTELPALGDDDWNSPRLVFSFLFSLLKRNTGRGKRERERPQVTFWMISLMPRVIKWEKGGRKRREVGMHRVERCVHFLSGLLGGSRQWISTEVSPCWTLSCHSKVCENSTHKELKAKGKRTKTFLCQQHPIYSWVLTNE